MKTLLAALAVTVLTACGAEVATTAATSAKIKKDEMEAGKQTMERVQKKLDEAAEAMKKQTEQQENSYK